MKILVGSLAIMLLVGCNSETPNPKMFNEAVATSAGFITLANYTPDVIPTPGPTPDNAKTCPDCKGSGKVKTGDGISWTECDMCEGTGKVGDVGLETVSVVVPPVNPIVKAKEIPTFITAATTVPFTIVQNEVCVDGSCAKAPGVAYVVDGCGCDPCTCDPCECAAVTAAVAGECITGNCGISVNRYSDGSIVVRRAQTTRERKIFSGKLIKRFRERLRNIRDRLFSGSRRNQSSRVNLFDNRGCSSCR